MQELLEQFKGQLVKVLYHDGDRLGIAKGDLTKISDSFIEIQSFHKTSLISVAEIIKVESNGGGFHG